jgi:GNAT superfamily N-acetyltransferase
MTPPPPPAPPMPRPPAPTPWRTIRDAGPADHAASVHANLQLALETEGKTLDPEVLAAGVSVALADPDRLRYWVADMSGQVVGVAAITREWTDWRNGWIWWLQSVYVWPEHRTQGVFRALYHHIRAQGRRSADVIGLRLYVEDGNTRGRRTYEALGMKPGGYSVYEDLWLDPRRSPPESS